jgi:gamma-glutamyltranspeptidase
VNNLTLKDFIFYIQYLSVFLKIMNLLKSERLVKELRAKIVDNRTFEQSYYGKSSGRDSHGTTHLSVYANGDAVSLTSSINT